MLDGGIVFEGNETEASGFACVAIHHHCRIENSTELGEVIAEAFLRCALRKPSHEAFLRSSLFGTGNSTFGVDLDMEEWSD